MPEAVVPSATPAPQAPPKRFEIPKDAIISDPGESAPKAPAPQEPQQPPSAEAVPQDGQKPEGEAPQSDPDAKKPATDDDPEKRRTTRRFERRIDKATRRAAEEKARADFLAKQLEDLKPKAAVDTAEPKIEDFDDIQKFADAKAKYAADKAVKELETKQREAAQREANERTVSEWEKKYSQGEDKYDDFEEKVGKLDPRIPMNAAIMTAENGHEIAYHLGTNLKEAERIIRLDPVSQIREIGRLEAKLLAEPAKPKAPSRAPAPITPLSGATPVASEPPTDQAHLRDWMRKRQRQVHGKN